MPEQTGGSADLDDIADALYALRPDEFVDARDDAVAQAKQAGDRDLARALGRLKRPTRAAWLANLLARERPDQLDGLLDLGPGLADAQRSLDGPALRKLTAQRHRLVRAVADEAARLAAARREPVGDGLLRDLGGILEAALADPVVAGQVRAGRLTRTVSHTGFGPAADGPAVPARRPRPAAPTDPDGDGTGEDRSGAAHHDVEEREAARREAERRRREERERAERELAEAEEELARARDRSEAADTERDEAGAEREDSRRRVAALTEELDAARERERTAAAAAREAETAARAAARDTGAAAARVARAQAALDGLPG